MAAAGTVSSTAPGGGGSQVAGAGASATTTGAQAQGSDAGRGRGLGWIGVWGVLAGWLIAGIGLGRGRCKVVGDRVLPCEGS